MGITRTRARLAAALVAAAAAVLMALPAGAWAATTADYSWYTAGKATGQYVISDRGDYVGFVNLVNGTADSGTTGVSADTFAGKTVTLGADINLNFEDIAPAGGANGIAFQGTFDGQGHKISSFSLVTDRTTNVGLIGLAGADSIIENVVLGEGSVLTLDVASKSGAAIKNVGLLVGCSEGQLIGCSTDENAKVTISTAASNSEGAPYTVQSVGGLAGFVAGNVTDCSNGADVTVSTSGATFDKTKYDCTAINVGGVVGTAGDVDCSLEEDASTADQVNCTVSGCSNSGTITFTSSAVIGVNSWDASQNEYTGIENMGGVIGYSKGSVIDCSNSGYVNAEASGYVVGGVVGCVRSSLTYDAYNGGITSSDDGMASQQLYVDSCVNTGDVVAHAVLGGIAGRCGSYVDIKGCTNGDPDNVNGNWVLGTRSNKPYPGGIAGASYGNVYFNVNYGQVASGVWISGKEHEAIRYKSGYYASGILAGARRFSGTVKNPVPQIYANINIGTITAGEYQEKKDDAGNVVKDESGNTVHVNVYAAYRQRAIIGDCEEGSAYDNVALKGSCPMEVVVYENGSGLNDYLSMDVLKGNGLMTDVSGYEDQTPLGVLNSHVSEDFEYYFCTSDEDSNGGWPVLNTRDAGVAKTDLSSAMAVQTKAACYRGVSGAVPTISVTLAGHALVQNVDYRVIPQADAIDMTDGATPYVATIQGIGSYEGSLTVAYGIGKLDLSRCSVAIESVTYDGQPHVPTSDMITVTDEAGNVVDPSEYTFGFDMYDSNTSSMLVNGAAVDCGAYYEAYKVKVTAKASSSIAEGSVEGTFNITQASLLYNDTDLESRAYATVMEDGFGGTVKYVSQRQFPDWDITKVEDPVVYPYTGHSIIPQVTVTFRGSDLPTYHMAGDGGYAYGSEDPSLTPNQVLVTIGSLILTGADTTLDNIGSPTERTVGGIYLSGRYSSTISNFGSYDATEFYIDPSIKPDLTYASAVLSSDTLVWEGIAFEPVTSVRYLGSELDEGTDYVIEYQGNNGVGTASYTIKPGSNGLFVGELTGTFTITDDDPYQITYEYDGTGKTAAVTGVDYMGTRDSFDVAIPETVQVDGTTYTVTSIADYAFCTDGSKTVGGNGHNDAIASVSIPKTVTSIGAYAFASTSAGTWRSLSSVVFRDADQSQLTTIGARAFQGCGNLTSFTFPAKVDSIGQMAFSVGSASTPSRITSLTFLTDDPALPGNFASKGATFTGIGGTNRQVTVYSNAGATAVRSLVSSCSTYGGRNWVSADLQGVATVTFDTTGGSTVGSQQVPVGVSVAEPATPQRAGCIFEGWCTSTDGGQTLVPYDFGTAVTTDMTIYADWLVISEYTGWWDNGDGTWSYLENGVAHTGWLYVNNRTEGDTGIQVMRYYWFDADGIMATGWQKVGTKWYWLGTDGAMCTGWQKISGKYYYFASSGAMCTGWQKIGGKYYYLNASGAMLTGWQKIGSVYYYFNGSGAMQTGWLKSGTKYYYLKSSGAMATGWLKVGSAYYYFNGSGVMQTGWLKSGTKYYYLKSGGAMATGWLKVSGKQYYFNASGVMVTGKVKIGNLYYTFSSSGVWNGKSGTTK